MHPLNSEGLVVDFRQVAGQLNLNFGRENFEGNYIRNSGVTSGFTLLEEEPQFRTVFLPNEIGSLSGTLNSEESLFDGISCNDRHMSVKMGSAQSFVRFVTPELEKWSEQNTVEFWFKLQN